MSEADEQPSAPLVFGEVLFDHFADGSRVLGGAPFNVAWHLQGFGRRPLFVSAVGSDADGQEVLDRMRRWGMRADGVQVDAEHPTGRVTARIVDGEPTFEIEADQAYDHVRAEKARESTGGAAPGLIYHGSLALRSEQSRHSLSTLREATSAVTYVDLNLRSPWWSEQRVSDCVGGADWLKLNRDELKIVTGVGSDTVAEVEEQALALADERGLTRVIVTLGDGGALMAGEGRCWIHESAPLDPDEVVDTVGAGDAFSAVACVGLLAGWTPREILARGNDFAAELCRVRGATTSNTELYERHRAAWGEAV